MSANMLHDDDWSLGGTTDPHASEAMGFSEHEAALVAVTAFQAVTEPGINASRERRLEVFFQAFKDGVLSYLDD